MKRVLKLTLLTMAFILALCGSALAAAGDDLNAGFYGIGSAGDVSITVLDANNNVVSAVAAEIGDTTATYYEGAVKLGVTYSGDVGEDDQFLVMLVDGDELPTASSTIRYIDQTSGEIEFVVYPDTAAIKSVKDMTLFITSNQEGFETISIPVSFAPKGAYVEAAARYAADVSLSVSTRNAMVYGATAYVDCSASAEAGAEGAAAGEALSGEIKLVVEGEDYSKSYAIEGYDNTLSIPTIGMNAGTYTVTAVLEDETCTYGGSSESCSFTIAPLEADVVWENTELIYDGTKQGPTAFVEDGCPAEGETLTLTVSGAQTNAGTYTATATLAKVEGGNARVENYVLRHGTCEFTIAGLPIALSGQPENIVLVNDETYTVTAKAEPTAAKAKVTYSIEDETIAKVTAKGVVSGVSNGITNLVITAAPTKANYETTVVKVPVVVVSQPVASISVEGQMGDSTLEYTENDEIVVNAVVRPDQEGLVIVDVAPASVEGMEIEAQLREIADDFGVDYEIDVTISAEGKAPVTKTYSVGYGLEYFYVGIVMDGERNNLDGLVDAVYDGLPAGADYTVSVAAADLYAEEGETVETALVVISTVGVELAVNSNRYEITGTYSAWVYNEDGSKGAVLVEDEPFTVIEGEVAITASFALGTDLAVVKHVDGEGNESYQQAKVNEDGYYTFTTSDFTGTFEAIEPVVEIMLDDEVVSEDEIGQSKNKTYTAAVGPDGVIDSGIVWELGAITNPDGTEYTGAVKNIVTLSKGKVTVAKTAPAGTLIEIKAIASVDESIVGTLTVEVAPTASKLAIFEDGMSVTKTTLGARVMGEAALTLTAGMADLTGAAMDGDMDIVWTVDKPAVATVEDGIVTAQSIGNAKITASATIDGKAYKATVTVTVTQLPETLTIIPGEAEVAEGKSLTLKAEMAPTPSNKNVVWSIVGAWDGEGRMVEDASAIATLSKGKIAGKGAGTLTVRAASEADPAVYAECTVTVIPAELYHNSVTVFDATGAKVSKLSLGFNNAGITGIADLNAVAYNKAKEPIEGAVFTWTTTDSAVATVDENGLVTAVGAGSAKIVATSSQGKAATVSVTVAQAPDAVTLTDSTGIAMGEVLMLGQGEKLTLKAEVEPEGIKNNKVVWETSDKSIVSVSSGKLSVAKTAKAGSIVTITAKSQTEASVYDSIDVMVTSMKGKAAVFFNGIAATKATFAVNELGEMTSLAFGVADLAGERMYELNAEWTSAKPAIVSVDERGNITANGVGSAKITGVAYDGGEKITVSCTVTVALAATEIETTSPAEQSVAAGKSVTLKATAARYEEGSTKNTAANKKVTWSIEGSDSITVSTSGKVSVAKTAKAGEWAVVTASAADGAGYAEPVTFTITVVPQLSKAAASVKTLELETGALASMKDLMTLTCAGLNDGDNAWDYVDEVTYTSAKPAVASVDEDGFIRGLTAGSAKITAKITMGGVTKSVTLTVKVVEAK